MAGFKQTFIGKLLGKIGDFFGSVWEGFLEPLAKVIAKNGGPVLLEIVQSAVLAAEHAGGSGSDKLGIAKDIIEKELKSKGLPIVWNAINGAIEAAVASMKAGK